MNIEGLPPGYKAVRYGRPKFGEDYLDTTGCLLHTYRDMNKYYLIVKPTQGQQVKHVEYLSDPYILHEARSTFYGI